MLNLYAINESFTNGYNDIFLEILSFVAIFCGVFVIITKNPIISVLYLIGLFLSISCYLIMLGMNFMGLSYLLVYIGAVSILFLFILMLINVRVSELSTDSSNSIPLAILVAISFNNVVYDILPYNLVWWNFVNKFFLSKDNMLKYVTNKIKIHYSYNEISFMELYPWNENCSENSHIESLGNIIYSNYSIWLVVTSIILLLAMVGAIVITIKPKT